MAILANILLQNAVLGKRLIYCFKDTKIVKSKKNNLNLRRCTLADVKREITSAFKIQQKKIGRQNKLLKKMKSLMSYVFRDVDKCDDAKSPSPGDAGDVDVEVRKFDEETYVIAIDTREVGVTRYHTDLSEKLMFCKAVAFFYKNWSKVTMNTL